MPFPNPYGSFAPPNMQLPFEPPLNCSPQANSTPGPALHAYPGNAAVLVERNARRGRTDGDFPGRYNRSNRGRSSTGKGLICKHSKRL